MNPEQQLPDNQQGLPSMSPFSQPGQASPAPTPSASPSYQTPLPQTPTGAGNGGHNPYEFIFSERHEPKQKAFGGNPLLKRVLIVVGGLVLLTIIAAIAVSLLGPKEASTAQLTEVVQEQQEIVRVADMARSSATSTDLKNLAVNIFLGVGTDQASLQKYLSDRKVKIDDTVLSAKQDTKTDTLLTAAKSTNTFDRTATQTLQSLLVTYRADLNTTYQEVKGTNARKELRNSYQTAELLIAQANKGLGQ